MYVYFDMSAFRWDMVNQLMSMLHFSFSTRFPLKFVYYL